MKILKENNDYTASLGFGDQWLAAGFNNKCFPGFGDRVQDFKVPEKAVDGTVPTDAGTTKKALAKLTKDGKYILYMTVEKADLQTAAQILFRVYVVDKATNKVVEESNQIPCPNVVNTFATPLNLMGTRKIAYDTLKDMAGNNFVTNQDIVDKKLNRANYTLVDVGKDPDAQKYIPTETYSQLSIGEPLLLWKAKGLVQKARSVTDDQQNVIDYLKKNFKYLDKSEIDVNELDKYDPVNLKDPATYPEDLKLKKYEGFFTTNDYIMYRPKNLTVGAVGGFGAEKEAFVGQATIDACVTQLDSYSRSYTEALNTWNTTKKVTNPNTDEKDKTMKCIKYYGLNGFKDAMQKGILRKNRQYKEFEANVIDPLFTVSPSQLDAWKLGRNKELFRQVKVYSTNPKRLKEEVLLKNIISENLNKLKQNKKESLREEMIIRKHLNILTEGRQIKKKSELNNFFGELLNEVIYLNSQGYDEKIISEEVLSSLWSLFGGGILGGAYDYFKEYIAKWVVEKLQIDPKGWLGNIIIVGLGNLKISDLLTIWKCDKFVQFMGGTISEAIIRKYTSSKNMEGPLEGILRNSITKMLGSTHFVKAIEEGLETAICPMLSELGTKIDKVSSTLASKEEKPSIAPSET